MYKFIPSIITTPAHTIEIIVDVADIASIVASVTVVIENMFPRVFMGFPFSQVKPSESRSPGLIFTVVPIGIIALALPQVKKVLQLPRQV